MGTGKSYEALSTAFADVFKKINEMIQSAAILVNGVQYELDIYLGRDYKVICVNYFCIPMHCLLTNTSNPVPLASSWTE